MFSADEIGREEVLKRVEMMMMSRGGGVDGGKGSQAAPEGTTTGASRGARLLLKWRGRGWPHDRLGGFYLKFVINHVLLTAFCAFALLIVLMGNGTANFTTNPFTATQETLLRASILFFSVTKSVICAVGILLNLSLVYVTVRAKWLHGICNILLMVYDASLIPFLAGVPFYLNQYIQGFPSMQIMPCFLLQSVPLFLFCSSFPLMLCIAVDRLLGSICPMKYRSFNKWAAVGVSLFVCTIYSLCYMFSAYRNALKSQPPIGCTTTAPLGSALNTLAKTNFALESLAVLIYIFIWVHMNRMDKKSRKRNGNGTVDIRRLFKSLFTILVVDFVGWSTNSISMTILDLIGVSPSLSTTVDQQIIYFFITHSLNYMIYISACSNSILLYSLSHDYRKAFDAFLPNWLINLMKRALCDWTA